MASLARRGTLSITSKPAWNKRKKTVDINKTHRANELIFWTSPYNLAPRGVNVFDDGNG